MANANVEQKNTETKASELGDNDRQVDASGTWRRHPSVLKGARYKIGDGEPDFVD